MQKRDAKTKKYHPYIVPSDWKCTLFTRNMDEEVNCTQCGQIKTYWDCYTSRVIHNPVGLGYPVCETCYNKEVK